MADTKDIIPPLERMIRQLNRPDHTCLYYTELVDRDSVRFRENAPMKRGNIYADGSGAQSDVISGYPTLYFCREFVPLGSNTVNSMQGDQYVIWTWASVPDAESSYNSEVTYLGDIVANPSFARSYLIRRDTYEASPTIALGSTLTALTGVNVTGAGSGYTSATGTVGTAACQFVISDGEIITGIVTTEGSGVTTGAAITITGDGTGATATARVQPVGAILTSQKKIELDEDDPLSHEFVSVVRVFEVLPGPLIPFTRWSDLLGPIQGTRRAVVNTGQAPTFTATAKTTYEARNDSAYVAWELVETNSNGTGGAGNPAYPIFTEDIHDDEKGETQKVTQVVVATGSEVSSFAVSGGVATQIDYLKIDGDPFHLIKVTTTYSVPGPILYSEVVNPDGTTTSITRQIELTSAITEGETVVSTNRVVTTSERINNLISWKVVATSPLTGNTLTGKSKSDEAQAAIATNTEQLLPVGSLGGVTPDFKTLDYVETPVGPNQIDRKVSTMSESAYPILTSKKWDELAQQFITTTKQIVASGATTASLSSGVLTEFQGYDKNREIKIITQYASAPSSQTIKVAVQVSVPPVMTGLNQISASSGIVNAYGLEYVLTQKSGVWPATLVRTFYTTLAAAVAAASAPDMRFTTEATAYGFTDAASSFNPNFLGHANVSVLHVPEHITSSATGTFVHGVQIQQHVLGYWVLEVVSVVLS